MRNNFILVFSICFIALVSAQEKTNKFSLDEAVKFAIKNNYDAKVAVNNIEAAKEKKWETTTIGLPQISAKVDYQNWLKQQLSLLPGEIVGGAPGTFVPVAFGTKQTMNAAITLNQLIFDGSYLVGLQSAKTYLKISEQAKEKTELSIREAVINAYGNVLVAQKSISILENNLIVLEKNLNDTQKIYQNGLNEEEDVEQLQITLANVKSQLNKTKRLKDIGYKMLNISMGKPIKEPIELTDNLDTLVDANISLSLLTKNFNLNNHIDFKIAENDREGKRLLMQLERSKALPTLSAFVNFGYAGNANSFDFLNSSQKWFDSSLLGVSLNIPVFSSFQRRSKTRQAKIELENSDVKLLQIEEQLNLGVVKAKSDYQFSIEQYDSAKQNLRLAERIEKKQQVKFFEGVSSSFDLSQAQNQLYTQQQNYIQSMLDVIAQKAALENALNIPLK
jgi:outer membrane protein TolC